MFESNWKYVTSMEIWIDCSFATIKHAQDWDEHFPRILFSIDVVYKPTLGSHLT
jgi:hypothetical protein